MAAARPGNHRFQEQQCFLDDQFDVLDWYPYFQSCVRYFLDHAQHTGPVQALAAFINIQLPFQRAHHHHHHRHHHQSPILFPYATPSPSPIPGGPAGGSLSPAAAVSPPCQHQAHHVSLQPYIRRLIATGYDFPAVLHSFFGDDWERGVRPLHAQEKRNYLFAAKSGSWLEVKREYDIGSGGSGGHAADETVPFLRPLRGVSEEEIQGGEEAWSEWLAMQDWMLGPRSVEVNGGSSGAGPADGKRPDGGVRIKREE